MSLRGTSYSATEALFGQPVPPELDPALLLTELRGLRPVIDRLSRLEPLIRVLEGVSIAQVQQLLCVLDELARLAAQLEHVGSEIPRVRELIQELDELDVIVRRG